jgi:hypothetical protein
MVFAVFAGWRCEERPGRVLRHRGVCNAHVLRGVGFTFPEAAVSLALGGNALLGAWGKLAEGFGFHKFRA